MKATMLVLILFFGIMSCKNSDKNYEAPSSLEATDEIEPLQDSKIPQIAQKIAKSNGFDNWDKISEIAFTFNVDRKGNHFERSWVWNPKTKDILMISDKNDTVSYNRTKMDSLAIKTDAAFINDKYWLLAPFQLLWDENLEYTTQETAVAPISKDTLGKLTIVYPNEGGYTPGDAYDFFYDKNHLIKEWNYRKGNTAEPSLSTTWEDYKNFNGIEIARMRRDSTGDFKLYFTDISIKTDSQD